MLNCGKILKIGTIFPCCCPYPAQLRWHCDARHNFLGWMMKLSWTRLRIRHVAVLTAFVGVAAFFGQTNASNNCPMPSSSAALRSTIDQNRLDQKLFSRAVMDNVNLYRCRNGLASVKQHSGLMSVAAQHAAWMAKNHDLSHRSSTPRAQTVAARIKAAVKRPKAGSENIGYVHSFRVDEVDKFYIGSQPCSFSTSSGKAIGKHSYESLARRIVALWMASDGHRANVLAENVTVVGSAMAFDPKGPHCGVYYLSQNFAG